MENWRDWDSQEKCCVSSTPTDGYRFRERSKSAFSDRAANLFLGYGVFLLRIDTSSQPVFGLYSVPLRFGQAWRASSRSHRAWGRVTA